MKQLTLSELERAGLPVPCVVIAKPRCRCGNCGQFLTREREWEHRCRRYISHS